MSSLKCIFDTETPFRRYFCGEHYRLQQEYAR